MISMPDWPELDTERTEELGTAMRRAGLSI